MKLFRVLACLGAVLFPLSLLLDPHAVFYSAIDWGNSLWLIGFNGEYFRHHFSMPAAFNTAPGVGIALPMFYGYLLYPSLGVLSAGAGPALALRLGCLAMVAVEFYALLSAGRAIFRHWWLSYAAAVTVVWSTYSLTDLYNRSALPEFFATGFLAAAVGFAFAATGRMDEKTRAFRVWMAGICAVLTLGIHPPTAVVAGSLILVLGLVLGWHGLQRYQAISRPVAAAALSVAAAGTLILSPWLYLTLKLGRRLAAWDDPFTIIFYPERSDTWLGRLSPVPYDWLSLRRGTVEVSTPYLEAPLAFGLMIILGWSLTWWWRSRRAVDPGPGRNPLAAALLAVAGGWFAFLLVLSLSLPLARHFVFLGPFLQFAYRLVGHANVALLIAMFAAGGLAGISGATERWRGQANVVAAVCITLAAMAAAMKLTHASAVATDDATSAYSWSGDRGSLLVEGRPNLAGYYAARKSVRELGAAEAEGAGQVNFPVGREGNNFGEVGPVGVQLPQKGWVVTNALVFPWTRIWVNGMRWGGERVARRGSYFALDLPAGASQLRWDWHPDPVWVVLFRVGRVTFVLAMLISGGWMVARAVGLGRAEEGRRRGARGESGTSR